MDDNTIPQQFQKLEEKVEQLVQRCHSLQSANSDLEGKVRALEEALELKKGNEQRYMEEKSIIRSRIDNLLTRLDQVVDSGQN